MGFFGKDTLVIGGIMLLLLLIVSGIGVWYYRDSQEQMKLQAEEISSLRTKAEIQDETISNMKKSEASMVQFVETLQTNFATIQGKTSVMENMLTGQRLQKAASQRPTQVQQQANTATKNLFGAIQTATDPNQIMQEIRK